jgi:hypothetical protein
VACASFHSRRLMIAWTRAAMYRLRRSSYRYTPAAENLHSSCTVCEIVALGYEELRLHAVAGKTPDEMSNCQSLRLLPEPHRWIDRRCPSSQNGSRWWALTRTVNDSSYPIAAHYGPYWIYAPRTCVLLKPSPCTASISEVQHQAS